VAAGVLDLRFQHAASRHQCLHPLHDRGLLGEGWEIDLIVQEEVFIHALAVGVATAGFDAGFQEDGRLEENIEKLAFHLFLVDVEGEEVVGDNRAFEFFRDDAKRAIAGINAAENELPGGDGELVLGENGRAVLSATQHDAFVVGANGDLLVAGAVFDLYLGLVAGEDVADAFHRRIGRPFRANDMIECNPRALPWADMGRTFGARIWALPWTDMRRTFGARIWALPWTDMRRSFGARIWALPWAGMRRSFGARIWALPWAGLIHSVGAGTRRAASAGMLHMNNARCVDTAVVCRPTA